MGLYDRGRSKRGLWIRSRCRRFLWRLIRRSRIRIGGGGGGGGQALGLSGPPPVGSPRTGSWAGGPVGRGGGREGVHGRRRVVEEVSYTICLEGGVNKDAV